MAGINFLGSYSGIDKSTVDQLMQVEKLPLVQLANKKTSITEKQNAWKDINTRLNSLSDKLKTLQRSETFTSKTSTSTDENTVSIVASKNAIAGTYKINVERLATSTTVRSGKILSTENAADLDKDGKLNLNKELGFSGSFNIISDNKNTDGTNISSTITISGKDSLKTIVENINATSKDRVESGVTKKGTGITASIIDGTLILSDEKTGARNITLTEDEGSPLLSNLKLTGASVGYAYKIGDKSKFTVNDVLVERDTNSVSDVIFGTIINLNKVHATTTETDTLKVSQDNSILTKAIQDFVDQYNSTMTFIGDKMAPGSPDIPASRGVLAGDSSLQRLQSSLRSMVTSTITNPNTDIKDISQLGVKTIDKHGQLQFNSSELTEALNKDPQNVMNFFTSKDSNSKEIGFGPKLNEFVNAYITSDKGIIKGKSESFDRSLKDLNKQIDSFNSRMERKEAYYTKMFAALDTAMMQSESQMSWLEGQVSAMNAQNKK